MKLVLDMVVRLARVSQQQKTAFRLPQSIFIGNATVILSQNTVKGKFLF